MNPQEPKVYIKHAWEQREGFRYEQPVEYCNGIRLTSKIMKSFEEIFGTPFGVAQRESRAYNNALKECLFDSHLWKNSEVRFKVFNKIYEFNLSGKSGSGSTTTPLFPFEIYMMNDGFEMVRFSELNAINPGLKMHSTGFEKIGDYEYHSVRIFTPERFYEKGKKLISLKFGFDKRVNFYFTIHTKENPNSLFGIFWDKAFQVDNDINNYQLAIEGKLKSISRFA